MRASFLLVAWAVAYAGTSLVACLRARRFFARPAPITTREPVLLVRPCAGREALLRENLATTAAACRRGDAVVFAIGDAEDGAAADANAACASAAMAGIDARVVVTGARAPNRKADQVARVLAAREAPRRAIVVVADSDVALASYDVDALVSALDGPAVAAAWAPPCATAPPATSGDRALAAVLDASLHAFPLLAGIDARGMVGKLFAVRRASLEWAGGFGALVTCLGEDMELARRLRAQGERTVHIASIARARTLGCTRGDAIARLARWIAVIRAQRPALLVSYPLLFCALPFFAAGTAIARDAPAAAALAIAVMARLGVAMVARAIAERRFSFAAALVDGARAEGILLAAFARAALTRSVRWRDRALRLDGATLVEDEP